MLPGNRRALNGQSRCDVKLESHPGRQERERGKPDFSPLIQRIESAAGDPRGKLLRERVREPAL
jgi:hypothetical protein